jgi:hypothetical protein
LISLFFILFTWEACVSILFETLMKIFGYLTAPIISTLLCPTPASAQFNGFNPGAFIGGGGRIPGAVINQGVGIIQEVGRQQRAEDAQRRREAAAAQARQRRAALSKTKAGRAQLAREDRTARQRARQQEQMMMGIIGAVGASIVGGGGGGGSSRTEYYYEERSGRSSSPAPQSSSSGFYGNCHGGRAYGC